MKRLAFIFAFIAIIATGLFTSCSKDDDGGSLSGVYGCGMNYVDGDGYGRCYEFINHNTVVYHPFVHDGELRGGNGLLGTTSRVGKSKWYDVEGSIVKTYTYVYEDNKVIIPMQGVILTYSGGKLYEDGSSNVFKK